MHARDVLDVVAGDHIAVEHVHFQDRVALRGDAADDAVVAHGKLDLARDGRIAPALSEFAARVGSVAKTAQHEIAWAHAGAPGDFNLAQRKRAHRALRHTITVKVASAGIAGCIVRGSR
jgi:hypothetical protein